MKQWTKVRRRYKRLLMLSKKGTNTWVGHDKRPRRRLEAMIEIMYVL